MRTNIRLLAWAGLGVALGVVFLVIAVHGGGFAVVPAVGPAPGRGLDLSGWDHAPERQHESTRSIDLAPARSDMKIWDGSKPEPK